MGIFNSYLLGSVKKSVGNVTMYVARGVSIVRGKPLKTHNPRTDKQLIQRSRMRALVNVATNLAGVLPESYPRTQGLVHASNRFVRDNMQAVTVDEDFNATVDYGKLVISSGRLKRIKVEVKYSAESNMLTFTQTAQPTRLAVNPRDIAYVVAYEKEVGESEIFELKPRKEGGEITLSLPEEWNANNCEFYTFVRNEAGSQTSRTTHLSLITD